MRIMKTVYVESQADANSVDTLLTALGPRVDFDIDWEPASEEELLEGTKEGTPQPVSDPVAEINERITQLGSRLLDLVNPTLEERELAYLLLTLDPRATAENYAQTDEGIANEVLAIRAIAEGK